ncbi:MAG: hypothetical protein ACE5H3_00015 [Planctomycetota bacterium]
MTFHLEVRGGLTPEVATDGHGVRFLDKGGATVIHYTGLLVNDAEGRRLPRASNRSGTGWTSSWKSKGPSTP